MEGEGEVATVLVSYGLVVRPHVVEECLLVAEVPIVLQVVVHLIDLGVGYTCGCESLDSEEEVLCAIREDLSSLLDSRGVHILEYECLIQLIEYLLQMLEVGWPCSLLQIGLTLTRS